MKVKTFVGDFETTVYEGQAFTEVWASALVELYKDKVLVVNSIDLTYDYLTNIECDSIVYYHNLKFDGSFWLYYLLRVKGFEQAYEESDGTYTWISDKDMQNNTVKYMISSNGLWYTLTFKANDHLITLKDSLKLLPFSVKRIGESFGTKHKKLEIEYTGYRQAEQKITKEERDYIANDVLVVKEALEIMFSDGHSKLTIGACCLNEFKKMSFDKYEYENIYYPDLSKHTEYRTRRNEVLVLPFENSDNYIRRSYRGGWCYVVQGKENKIITNGCTADVNSLYPSMMSSESGNYYPYGKPLYFKGDIPRWCIEGNENYQYYYYFIRLKTRFKLKEGMLPFIQIKNNILYPRNEMLTTSDVRDRKTGKYYSRLRNGDEVIEMIPELTLTCTDYELFKKHYDLYDTEILDGCYFRTEIGMFDRYICRYKEQKMVSKGAKREQAKLFLNNLYGKMATNDTSSFKIAYIRENDSLGYFTVEEHSKKVGYIPVGSAITAYARRFTITSAQENYHGVDKKGFIYADTDSIHCDLDPSELKGITIHDKNFCAWKIENRWDKAIFVRQKTYIEHNTHADEQPLEKPYYNIKCAGMGKRVKDKFNAELKAETKVLTDFKPGLCISGNLKAKNITGGILLVEQDYKMR